MCPQCFSTVARALRGCNWHPCEPPLPSWIWGTKLQLDRFKACQCLAVRGQPESASRFWNSSKITHTLTQTYISLTHRLRLLLNKLFSLCLKDSINYFSPYLINSSFYFSFPERDPEGSSACFAYSASLSIAVIRCQHVSTLAPQLQPPRWSMENCGTSWNHWISTCFNSVSTWLSSALVSTHSVWHAYILLAAKVWFRCSCLILRKSGKLKRIIDMYL